MKYLAQTYKQNEIVIIANKTPDFTNMSLTRQWPKWNRIQNLLKKYWCSCSCTFIKRYLNKYVVYHFLEVFFQ